MLFNGVFITVDLVMACSFNPGGKPENYIIMVKRKINDINILDLIFVKININKTGIIDTIKNYLFV